MIALVAEKREQIVELCRRYQARRLELFGSSSGENFDERESDVDFLVEFEPTLPREHASCYFNLLFSLQDLLARSVDLVELSAVSNPFFLSSISRSRVLLYAA